MNMFFVLASRPLRASDPHKYSIVLSFGFVRFKVECLDLPPDFSQLLLHLKKISGHLLDYFRRYTQLSRI